MTKAVTNGAATIALTVTLAASTVGGIAHADEDAIGLDEYRTSCLSCHGEGGRGDGPLAKFLNVKPSDLTMLAKNNGGQYPEIKAGAFPFLHVYQTIDGRSSIEVHGARAMPVWGNRYLAEQPASVSSYGGEYEKVVRGRILELVYYIQSIQQ